LAEKVSKYKYPGAVLAVKILFVLAAICGIILLVGSSGGGYAVIGYFLLAGIPGLALFIAGLFGLLVIAIVRASRPEGWQAQLETNQEADN
jgi:hypothetical protein